MSLSVRSAGGSFSEPSSAKTSIWDAPVACSYSFDRRIQMNIPGEFSTRVITAGVAPSLHVEYKRTGIKQYFKENRALRTETTINDARGREKFPRYHRLLDDLSLRRWQSSQVRGALLIRRAMRPIPPQRRERS